jgi:hypothetical protein
VSYQIDDICWYTGKDNRLVSDGRICHITGNGAREWTYSRPFRRGELYFVISGTPLDRWLRINFGSFTGHAAWVHPRHLIFLHGRCVNCHGLKPANDYICIKCRSKGVHRA